jgi:hypothetical protein
MNDANPSTLAAGRVVGSAGHIKSGFTLLWWF